VGFAGGGVFDEREEVKTREDRVGEEMGGECDVLGRGKVGAKVEVRQIDGPEESVRRDNRIKKEIDAGKRSELTWVEGGQEESRRSPPAVPRTRRSTSEVRERRGPGMEREEGDHFSLGMGLK
jgi:hypothetical protein